VNDSELFLGNLASRSSASNSEDTNALTRCFHASSQCLSKLLNLQLLMVQTREDLKKIPVFQNCTFQASVELTNASSRFRRVNSVVRTLKSSANVFSFHIYANISRREI
jgi:hypothetical protein